MSISLCIPRVFKNISRKYIIDVFNILEMGGIERVDLIRTRNHQKVFIHMFNLNDKKHPKIRPQLEKGGKIKILYDDPWYWEVSKSRSPKPPAKIPSYPRIIFVDQRQAARLYPNNFPDQGCGIYNPTKMKFQDWRPAEFTIGRH